ncbi:Sulfotransferase domain-containing protein [Catalinimonas alkaloidigena]|uniref:Sulfotransferase domain-containing protein n=1 Tax=Catalinimonas alkaloidigena TaxID=1075417 RepID=A0A1G9LGB8_9BACT|nr:sulfotransferase domain-containing protein [Catalinimonas alkaloidigena]SDL60978.1 Sulfotransferase domain-containing protein [Catalinimonas alkaloidigena]
MKRLIKSFWPKSLEKEMPSQDKDTSSVEVYTPKPDDFFLVSYPKSGSTWVRFLLANYFFDADIDFVSIRPFVPDLHSNRDLVDNLQKSPRIIKHHLLFEERFEKAIYVVRDGRDVAVSYYFFNQMQGQISKETSFSEYLRKHFFKDLKPFGSWGTNVQSWLAHTHDRQIIVVRYEDLLKDAATELERIVTWMGQPLDAQKIARAVEHSQLKAMREAEYKSLKRGPESEHKFTRKGVSGDWKNHFSDEDLKCFQEKFGEQLSALKYG